MKLFLIVLASLLLLGCTSTNPTETAYHVHSDFKVYLNNQAFDFSLEKYQTPYVCGDEHKESNIHLHGGNGEVVHVHDEPATWKEFFESLGGQLSSTCFIMDSETSCGDLRFFVNGEEVFNLPEREINDLDKVLITLNASQEELSAQLNSITNFACIESRKCDVPEGYVLDKCST
ncbi:hypothetical protein HUU53_04615 [Candidatus Micrarchaeota archaeon]|nr:hypothetical protein [Candidatus Micrarchaeota archaeon]